VAEKGQIVKVSKEMKGVVSRERPHKKWTDWMITGPWILTSRASAKSSASTHEPKQVQMPGMEKPEQLDLTEYEEVGPAHYIFENEWPIVPPLRKTVRWN